MKSLMAKRIKQIALRHRKLMTAVLELIPMAVRAGGKVSAERLAIRRARRLVK